MTPNSFNDEDIKKYVAALNYVATELRLKEGPDVSGLITGYKHFSFLQSLVPKLEAHVAEVIKVHHPEEESQ